eukprot:scaffold32851_cov214-Skeletonema_dohrnii-CCMP3373.AAC.2
MKKPLESALRKKSTRVTAFEEYFEVAESSDYRSKSSSVGFKLPLAGDGRPKFPITSQLDDSGNSRSTATKEKVHLPQMALSFESLEEEKRPIRTVTWNVEEVKKEEEDQEETLSMLGRRKYKAWRKQVNVEMKAKEQRSWKVWFWSHGCPCGDWSPMYLFRSDEESTVATSKCDESATGTIQSSVATSTFVTLDEDVDDDSTIPSFSRVGSTLDESIIEDDTIISDVSSNSSDGTMDSEIEEELEIQAKPQPPTPKLEPPKLAPPIEVNIVKDWSREGLSTHTIGDMDLFMDAMRS